MLTLRRGCCYHFFMIDPPWTKACGTVGYAGQSDALESQPVSRLHLTRGGHAHGVGTTGFECPDLSRRLVAGACNGGIDARMYCHTASAACLMDQIQQVLRIG